MKMLQKIIVLCAILIAQNAFCADLDDSLAGVKLGITVDALKKIYPKIYSQKLVKGEVLYQACNQTDLSVFTFTEEPWSPGVITYISVKQEGDISVCRDENGSLPDYGILPSTPRGIKLGDLKVKVIQEYGAPTEEKEPRPNLKILKYSITPSQTTSELDNLVLFFQLSNDTVKSISIQGNVPGAKVPY